MRYTGDQLREIRFPLGGIGTGAIHIAGNGSLLDWEIFNRPNKGSFNYFSFFAVRAVYPDGRSVTRVLQGDWDTQLMGQYRQLTFTGYGYGPGGDTMCSFPHFKKVTFRGEFPFATLTFEDPSFPGRVVLRAFNPFIPLNANDSGLPAAFFDVQICGREDAVSYSVILSVANPFAASENRALSLPGRTAVTLRHHGKTADDLDYGDLTVAVDGHGEVCQEYWYRGRFQDNITTFWKDLTAGTLAPRHYDTPGHRDVCSVGRTVTVDAGKRASLRFLIAWNVPNNYNYWDPYRTPDGRDVSWKNHYATRFADSAATAVYGFENWNRLYRQSRRFCRSLHTATLDKTVIEAASATLAVLKSPTVLRLTDGSFYGWEGVHEREGSCEGTCTHVWSYAYALCFLFPELERSIRNVEFQYDVDEDGRMLFRTALPLGRSDGAKQYVEGRPVPCVDGQMATVIKTYREWKISGDTAWLKQHWDTVKRLLSFAWSDRNEFAWDRDKDGVLEGMQHHTLDMELFGPSSWLQSMYLAALKAGAEMAEFLGDTAARDTYVTLFEKGRRFTDTHLFNGRYYHHKVDLENREQVQRFGRDDYWNEEQNEISYQIGEGCQIDQMLGQWHAHLCGLGDILDPAQRQTALSALYQNNFKPSLREVANMWRVFALNDEGGTLICTFPEGCRVPAIPVPYCEECMTGFEYALAGLFVAEGREEEGLALVRAVRGRYNGRNRNPWNEIECGNNYARSMASFALFPIFSGFTFDLPHRHVGFAPRCEGDFRCLWSLGTGWGDFIRTAAASRLVLADGYLELESFSTGRADSVTRILADGVPLTFTQQGDILRFSAVRIQKELTVEWA